MCTDCEIERLGLKLELRRVKGVGLHFDTTAQHIFSNCSSNRFVSSRNIEGLMRFRSANKRSFWQKHRVNFNVNSCSLGHFANFRDGSRICW